MNNSFPRNCRCLMFRVNSKLSSLPCPINVCTSSFCPFNHLVDPNTQDIQERIFELDIKTAAAELGLNYSEEIPDEVEERPSQKILDSIGAVKLELGREHQQDQQSGFSDPVPPKPAPTYVPFENLCNPEGDLKPYLPDLQKKTEEIRKTQVQKVKQEVHVKQEVVTNNVSRRPSQESPIIVLDSPPRAPASIPIKKEPQIAGYEESDTGTEQNADMTINTECQFEFAAYKSKVQEMRRQKAEAEETEKLKAEKQKKTDRAEKSKPKEEREKAKHPEKEKSKKTEKEKTSKKTHKEKEEGKNKKKRSRDETPTPSTETPKRRKRSSKIDEYVPEPVSKELVLDTGYVPHCSGAPVTPTTPVKSILKKGSDKERLQQKVSSATESYLERKKKLKPDADFSKKKIASAASDESAKALRPLLPKPKPRDINQDLHKRLTEAEPVRKTPTSKMGTEYNPAEKNPRIAHSVSNVAFRCVPITNCKVPPAIRQQQLQRLQKALVEKVQPDKPPHGDILSKQVALEIERELATKAQSRGGFTNAMNVKVSQVRKANFGDPRFQPKHDLTKVKSVSMNQALACPKLSKKIKIKPKNELTKLTGDRLYKAMSTYVLSRDDQWDYGYPRATEKSKKVVEVKQSYMDKIKKMTTGHPTKRRCCRCQAEFEVDVTDGSVSEGDCYYHSGKLYPTRTSHEYSCCGGGTNSDPCKFSDNHVHEENRLDLTGYDRLASLKKVNAAHGDSPDRAPAIFALDCEMVYTVVGFELARVTIIDERMDVILNQFCKPKGAIIDYNQKYSGISEADIRSCTADLKEVQKKVRYHLSEDDILVGHSLDSDLKALKIHHKKCVDTAAVYPHKRGLPYKRGLKTLMREECGKVIQQETEDGAFGHDSSEDAKAALELMFKKLEEDQKAGKFSDDE